ncbi:Crp/Fnr family transcriptional regulator [Azohydromonas lata]
MALTDLTPSAPLLSRSRMPRAQELPGIPWLSRLEPGAREQALASLRVVEVEPGELLCRVGRPPIYWFGVLDGLLKVGNDGAHGTTVTYMGVPPGGWFGEGTALKREGYRFNVQALRRSVIAGLPIDCFDRLLESSLGFNRFLMQQLNERLGQFIAARDIDRLTQPDARVARSLAALFDPVLYPGVGEMLRITQQELAYLVGLSRQRVNRALRSMQAEGVIRIEYGGVRVLALDKLRHYGPAD